MDEHATQPAGTIAEYADGPNRLERAIQGLSGTDLDLALGGDSGTIRQIVHHIANADDMWESFIKRAIGDPGGQSDLAWYWQKPQDEWTECWR